MSQRLLIGNVASIILLDHPGMTAPLIIGPSLVIEATPEPDFPSIDFRIPRKEKRRDWEQRNRKRARK